jgi:alkaline phosphatase D
VIEEMSKIFAALIDQARRRLLFVAASGTGAGLLAACASGGGSNASCFAADPFSLDIASGDSLANGLVLWTQLATGPLYGDGVQPQPVLVQWQVAENEAVQKKRGYFADHNKGLF